MLTANELRELPTDQVQQALSQLNPQQLEHLQHDWNFWARPEQIEPEGNWNTWFINAGRGFGKDLAKSEPILTTQGWKTMGEVQVGDYVYAWDGTPTEVVDLYEPAPRQLVKLPSLTALLLSPVLNMIG